MQTMKLAAKFMPLIRTHRKIRTIRKGIKQVSVGAALTFVNADDELDRHTVFITGAQILALKRVTDGDAQMDGFRDWDDLLVGLREFYPDLTIDEEVTIIDFK